MYQFDGVVGDGPEFQVNQAWLSHAMADVLHNDVVLPFCFLDTLLKLLL